MRTVLTLLIALVTGGCLVWMGISLFQQSHEFAGKGVEHSTGTIDSIGSGGRSRGDGEYVGYHYTDKAGVTYLGSSEYVSDAIAADLANGQSVPVKYLEADPKISRIDLPGQDDYLWRHSRNLGILGFVVLGLILFSALKRLGQE